MIIGFQNYSFDWSIILTHDHLMVLWKLTSLEKSINIIQLAKLFSENEAHIHTGTSIFLKAECMNVKMLGYKVQMVYTSCWLRIEWLFFHMVDINHYF